MCVCERETDERQREGGSRGRVAFPGFKLIKEECVQQKTAQWSRDAQPLAAKTSNKKSMSISPIINKVETGVKFKFLHALTLLQQQ